MMQPNEPAIPGALAENIPECPSPEKTEKAEHHYLRRYFIWAKADNSTPAEEWGRTEQGWNAPPVQYAWKPYDPSSVQPVPPREDLDNYFYVNNRYAKRDVEPDVVFSHFSTVLTDFLRMAIGDEFFEPNPESPLTHFVFKLDELKAHHLDARSALSNISGEELKTKARDLGRLDSLTPQKTMQDAQQYLEDLVNQLDILIPLVEKEFEPISKRLELELSYNHISFDLLMYYFKNGEKYYYESLGNKMAFVLDDTSRDSTLNLNGCGMKWDGNAYVHETRYVSIPRYPGTKALSDLHCKIMQDDVHDELTERGRLYTAASGIHFKSYDGRRVIVDHNGYRDRAPASSWYLPSDVDVMTDMLIRGLVIMMIFHRVQGDINVHLLMATYIFLVLVPLALSVSGDNSQPESLEFPEDQLCLLPVKSWGTFDVRKLEEIHFDEHAWDHLVLDKSTKTLVKGLVNVTKTTNTSKEVFSDVIAGKGGGLIALLHGPPGTGKTLTAEAVAEHLKRPLYVLSSLELSTIPAELETKLGDVLKLATTWDAVVLIDEADVFLEQRSLHELERNALVSVALRVLEYHRGVLFLTTNRIQAFDEAFLSRFSIAVKYPELDVDARLTIWRKFFELAGCELWGGSGQPEDGRQSPDEFVKLEGQEPQCYVSLADLRELAAKPFNGRTIKNLVRTAQALAMSSDEPLSLEHVKVVVEAQEKFLTEFANMKV
ncbi:P-loop containing nucleoside triphosphate hydrolase protein [Suillus hirtellus]|nr:P-loop containing nucleoside triphosphate hydrolase protein [Suillus hirtellus]